MQPSMQLSAGQPGMYNSAQSNASSQLLPQTHHKPPLIPPQTAAPDPVPQEKPHIAQPTAAPEANYDPLDFLPQVSQAQPTQPIQPIP